jgi:SAM-dependent methyltransferase
MSEALEDPTLPFTGERFTPECVREMWLEHYARYAFATRFAHGRHVLDCASGEGFGAAMLSRVARQVDAVDVSAEAIGHARKRYGGMPRLFFHEASALALPFPDAHFDLVVSFETLEHLVEHEPLIDEFARVLKPDGLLLISTPDKAIYSDKAGYRNEFHPRELYRPEFEALLARHFAATEIYGQQLLFQSAISSTGTGVAAPARAVLHTMDEADQLVDGLAHDAVYLIAACARRGELLAPHRGLSHWFGDAAQAVYQHYQYEIRQGIRGGHRIQELEAENAALRAQIAQLRADHGG